MASFLLEIGCEEIPARFVDPLLDGLKTLILQSLDTAGVTYSPESVRLYSTYRRLTLTISDIAADQPDREEIIQGPPLSIARKEDGTWLPPAIGFSKKTGVDPSAFSTAKDAKGREVLSVTKQIKGQLTPSLLPGIITDALKKLQLPIAMRWADQAQTFIRPVHWIVCLFDSEVVPLSFVDQNSGRITRGHRFLTQCPEGSIEGVEITLNHASAYEQALEAAQVVVSPVKRRATIEAALTPFHKQHYSGLISEVVQLVEQPHPMVCSFDSKYLDLPEQVLIQTMVKHQKYFPLFKSSALSSDFLVVADNVTAQNKATIQSGNVRVLSARLEDARFFYEEDLKLPLSQNVDKLESVLFQEGLGSLRAKLERIGNLAKAFNLVFKCQVNDSLIDETLSYLKSDLVSLMVYEFPSLQGVMGELYALKQGVKPEIAQAIREHYMPLSSGADVPESVLGSLMALADRIDTIVGSYAIDQIPSGSKDPLGIRRALYGCISLCHSNQWNLSMDMAFDAAYDAYGLSPKNKDVALNFYQQRLQTYLQELGYAYDLSESVVTLGTKGFVDALEHIYFLNQLKQKDAPSFKALTETAVRVKRLSKKATSTTFNPAHFELDIEKECYEKAAAFISGDRPLFEITTLSPLLSSYFDSVMVMVEDETLKETRLGFLATLSTLYAKLADFEKVVL